MNVIQTLAQRTLSKQQFSKNPCGATKKITDLHLVFQHTDSTMHVHYVMECTPNTATSEDQDRKFSGSKSLCGAKLSPRYLRPKEKKWYCSTHTNPPPKNCEASPQILSVCEGLAWSRM
mmetsp:Transcript_8229/g.12430  ORF Transcript_8229/g.12430 Transcript_8229/m.12430 type:complete len:119 (-) Transcript_8229:151-507(-)